MEKNQLEAKRVQQLQRINQRIEKDKETTAREKEHADWQRTQARDVLSVWKAATGPLSGYLLTSEANLPRLAWLPVSHNDVTQALLEDRKREVAALILDQECRYEELERKIDETTASNEARRAREASEMMRKYQQDGGDFSSSHLSNAALENSDDVADTSAQEEDATDLFSNDQEYAASTAATVDSSEPALDLSVIGDMVSNGIGEETEGSTDQLGNPLNDAANDTDEVPAL